MSMNTPTAPAAKKTNWFLIAAGGASILGLLALVMKNQGGGTTAAGTSINAALGSLQEEQLNTQGAVGALQVSLGLPTNTTLTDYINQQNATINSGLDAVSGQVAGVSGQVSDSANQAATNQAANAGFLAGIISQIQAILAGQANLQSGVSDLQTGQGNQNTELQSISQSIAGLTAGQQAIIINGILSDAHNQINFNAVQAALSGQPNPVLASATNGSTF